MEAPRKLGKTPNKKEARHSRIEAPDRRAEPTVFVHHRRRASLPPHPRLAPCPSPPPSPAPDRCRDAGVGAVAEENSSILAVPCTCWPLRCSGNFRKRKEPKNKQTKRTDESKDGAAGTDCRRQSLRKKKWHFLCGTRRTSFYLLATRFPRREIKKKKEAWRVSRGFSFGQRAE